MKWGLRSRAFCAAAIATGLIALPTSSAQGAAINVNVDVSLQTGQLLNNLQTLVSTVPTTANSLLCPVTSGLPFLPLLTCNLDLLSYQWHTQWKAPNGTIVKRNIGALLEIPTLLNVDNDIAPDVVATVGLRSLSPPTFALTVDRAFGESSTLPLSVEAIIPDPTKGSLPRKKINFGYDTKESRAPGHWESIVAVRPVPDGTGIDLVTKVTGQGPVYSLLGGLFNGTADMRFDEAGGRLRYSNPAPAQTGITFNVGKTYAVGLTTSEPTVLDADAVFNTGSDRISAALRVDKLQNTTGVTFTPTGTDQRQVTYSSSAKVAQMIGSYRHFTDLGVGPTTPLETLRAKATDVPTKIIVNQTAKAVATMTTDGSGPLGSLEMGFANGEPVLMNVDHPYARVVENSAFKSFAGRIDALQSASVDATDDVVADLQLGPDGRKPFRAEVTQSTNSRSIVGTVSDLPRHLQVRYDPDNGVIDYNANGETIAAIDVTAEQTPAFFGRVRKIVGHIEQLPTQATVNIKPNGAGLKLETNNPIGLAQALLTSGPDSSLPDGVYGAKVEDLASRFTAFARVQGLSLVDVTTGPAAGAVTGHVKLAPTPLKVIYATDAINVDASLSQIPSDVTVAFDPAAGTVTYNGNQGIARIDALVTATNPLFGRIKRIDARIDELPNAVAVGFKPTAGSGVEFSATPQVGMVQAALTDGIATAPTLADGKSGAILKDVPSEFSAFARLFNVQAAKVVSVNGNLDANLKAGPLDGGELQDLDLDATVDVPGDAVTDPMHIVGFVQDLPSDLTIKQTGSEISYLANAIVPKVTVTATGLPGGSPGGSLDGDLHNVAGTLTDVPTQWKFVNTAANTGVEANGPFTRADIELWDHGAQNAAFPEDARNKVSLNTRDGRLHVQARALAIQKVLLGMASTTNVETLFGSQPAPLDLTVDGGTAAEPLDVDVTVTDLPTASTFQLSTLLGMKIGWTAANPGTDVTLKLASKDVGADLSMPDLPSFVDVCVGGGLLGCAPKAPSFFQRGADSLIFPNAFTAVTNANGTIAMSGKVCLPPTDDDGEALSPPGTVYGACLDGTSPNRIEIDNLRLKQVRLEFASGDTTNEDEDGDPLEDDLLKLWVATDSGGIKVDNLFVRNDTSDSSTVVRAGHTGGLPLRNSGDHFFLLADMSFPPNTEIRENQIECGDLEVKVDLPLLGLTDVLPSPGELLLGDLCID